MLRPVCQVAPPVVCQTMLFGRDRQVVAWGHSLPSPTASWFHIGWECTEVFWNVRCYSIIDS